MLPQNADHEHRVAKFAEVARGSVQRRDGNVGNSESSVCSANDKISLELVAIALGMNLFEHLAANCTISRLAIANRTARYEPSRGGRQPIGDSPDPRHLLLRNVSRSDCDS